MTPLLELAIAQLIAGGVTVDADHDEGGSFEVSVDPLPWRVHFFVRDGVQLVVHGVVPIASTVEQRSALAEFFTRANFGLVIGNFEFDIDTGEMRYKTSLNTVDGSVDPSLIRPVFTTNITTTAEYMPGILAVVRGESPAAAIALVEAA